MTETVIVHLASLIELAGALGIAGCCTAAVASLLMRRLPGRAQALLIEGSLWGLGLKTAASLLKTLVVHDWNGILAFAAVLALRTVLKWLFTWERQRIIGEAEGVAAAVARRQANLWKFANR